jgi:hypothetical protein
MGGGVAEVIEFFDDFDNLDDLDNLERKGLFMKHLLTLTLAGLAAASASAKVESHWDGGRNTPVHRLALNDEFGDPIVPGAPDALPLSTRMTCGQCHDYDTIASGWHFNMSSTNAVAGRPAQPWFLIDPLSGSQIPMSLRGWPGTYRPGQLGMTDWEWVYAFGRHLPGGDVADPKDLYAEGGPNARWDVSGPVEINCFACHSQSKAYDHSEWVRLILRQNFRWAATGALGLGEIRGMGSRVADYWGVLRGLNRDDAVFAVPPHVVYDTRQFDAKNRAVLDVGAPRSENCLNCHSTSQAGMPHKDIDGDVHLRAGMSCADCHGNGEDHATARGYEGDTTGKMDKTRASASCVGCHMGTDLAKAGRHGAPAPKHTGIPVSHFRELTCTACHSGVTEDGALAQVRTSRANRMGVYGRARWVTSQPFILEPVFVRNDAGKIEPRRMAWPAFWGVRDGSDAAKIEPLRPEAVAAACAGLLDVREQAGAVLATLATDPNRPGTPVLAVDGKLFKTDVDGRAEPAGEAAQASGLFYQTATNLVAVIPAFDPHADTEKMTEEQLVVRQDNEKKLSNLLQTLDASPFAATNGYGAVVYGDTLFFRGGADDAMISTNAPVKADAPAAGWYKDGAFTPLVSAYVAGNVRELGGSECTVTEGMVAAGLKRLAETGQKGAVYVAHGQVWELAADGTLSARIEKAAEAVSWAVGHDVRPARMARGAKPAKCADCHTVDSPFFFAKVTSTGPLLTARTLVKAQSAFMGLSGSYNKVFGTTFLMRPFFKIFLWAVFAVLVLVAVAFVSAAVPVVLAKGGIPYGKPSEKLMAMIDKGAAAGLGLAGVYLGLSGLLGWFFHLMTGYILVFHMVAGGLFAACLVALIWLRGGRRIANPKRSPLWMVAMVLGVGVVFTAVAPMMTWFGEEWQWAMLWAHRLVAMAFLAVAAWMLLTGGRKE